MSKFGQLYGSWAVVTGASEGIGREFAVSLANKQLNIVLVARREPLLRQLALTLSRENGVLVHVVVADLTTSTGLSELKSACTHLDIGLFVAAAGFGTSGNFISNSIADECSMLALNCNAVLELTLHFARRFVAQKRGGIILLSSLVAFQGVPRSANYAATKAYVQTLAEGLRVELKPHGVEVLAAAPGPVSSGFAARANMQMSRSTLPNVVAKESLEQLGNKTTVRPGFLSKFLGYSLALLPRWGRVRLMTMVMAGMTKSNYASESGR